MGTGQLFLKKRAEAQSSKFVHGSPPRVRLCDARAATTTICGEQMALHLEWWDADRRQRPRYRRAPVFLRKIPMEDGLAHQTSMEGIAHISWRRERIATNSLAGTGPGGDIGSVGGLGLDAKEAS